MPNWVKTIVKTKPEVLSDILKKYSVKDSELSFNKVIPMPKKLNVEKGSRGEEGLMCLYLKSNKINKEKINVVYRSLNPFHNDIDKESRFKEYIKKLPNKSKFEYIKNILLAKRYISNFDKYGHAEWYNWRCDKWGTKWDLTRFDSNKDTMVFETAWSFAENIILELSTRYPEVKFMCLFADEGIQENSGITIIENGNIIDFKYILNENEIEEIWNYNLQENIEININEEDYSILINNKEPIKEENLEEEIEK